MSILITGGAGYIGSHTVLQLLRNEYDVVVIDNLINSNLESLKRVEGLVGKKITTYIGDVTDSKFLKTIFDNHSVTDVIHFAGLKSVSESINDPLLYYKNNVQGSLCLITEMAKAGVYNLIFSSSATVYGSPQSVPLTEMSPLGLTTNPYGTSKLMIEQILRDFTNSNPNFKVVCLRYFNPVGADPSGCIGESPIGTPNNIFPYLTQVALGKFPYLSIFGDDYPTIDGTGVRDYIHVVDLALGHLAALKFKQNETSFAVFNLGTGTGYSVLELVNTFEEVTGIKIPCRIVGRRPGDVAECWSDPSLAKKVLFWEAKKTLVDMVRDAWNWQQKNPSGYSS